MKKENMKLFVGGYFDDRIFEGNFFEGKTPFDKNIDTYTLKEALELGFVEPVIYLFNERHEGEGKEWDFANVDEKIQAVIDYTLEDDIAGLLYFDTEEKAEKYKQEVLKEIKELEKQIKYVGKKQDKEGIFREIYRVQPVFEYPIDEEKIIVPKAEDEAEYNISLKRARKE